MIISFCFTTKVINSMDNLDIYQNIITKAITFAKKYHKVNFYTDAETLSYLNISDVNIKLIDTNDFYFIDDFKIHLLSIISDEEVLIDTDLFLFNKLKLEDGHDIYVDFKDSSKNKWYTEYLNWCIDNGISEIVPEFGNVKIKPPNIGILKITNKELKSEYIELYNSVKKWILTKDKNINKGISIILGQYLLGIILQHKYKVYHCSGKHKYTHLSGPIKFNKDILERYLPNNKSKLF